MSNELIPLTRTLIFEGVQHDYRWSADMLTAIASARSLGVPRFEIDVEPTTRDVPLTEPAGKDWFGSQIYTTTGTKQEPTARIRVYAIRVEGA